MDEAIFDGVVPTISVKTSTPFPLSRKLTYFSASSLTSFG